MKKKTEKQWKRLTKLSVGSLKDKIDKTLARLTKKKRERAQINKIINKKETLQLMTQKFKGS